MADFMREELAAFLSKTDFDFSKVSDWKEFLAERAVGASRQRSPRLSTWIMPLMTLRSSPRETVGKRVSTVQFVLLQANSDPI